MSVRYEDVASSKFEVYAKNSPPVKCLVPDGVIYFNFPSKEELWDRYYTGAHHQDIPQEDSLIRALIDVQEPK